MTCMNFVPNMQDYPRIQVCIMTYNRPDTVQIAIESVLKQTYPNVELKLSDNSTNQDTFQLLLKSNDWGRYKYVKREPPLTGIDHLNTIIGEMTADYFIVFHDDDEMFPDMIERLYSIIIRDDAYSAVGANAYVVKGNKKELAFPRNNVVLKNGDELINQYKIKEIAPFPSYLYNRKKIGNIRLDGAHKGGKYSDVSFLFDIANKGYIVYVGEPLMFYNIHPGQDSGNFDFVKHVQLTNYLRRNCLSGDVLSGLRLFHIYKNATEGFLNRRISFRPMVAKILLTYSCNDYFVKYIIRIIQNRVYV